MINWRAIPAFRLLLPYALGILLAVVSTLSVFLTIPLCLLFFGITYFLGTQRQTEYSRRWWFGLPLSCLMFVVGYLAVQQHDEFLSRNHYSAQLKGKENSELIVQIDELPSRTKRVKLLGKVLQCNGVKTEGHILLYLTSDDYSLQLEYGDIIAIRAAPQQLLPPKNPYSFDFQNYMKLRNVRYNALVDRANIQTLAERRGNFIMHLAYDAQAALIGILAQHLTDDDIFSVGSALILGNRSEISEEVLDAYINTGAMHVLSVSGLHVGLVATLFSWFVRKIRGRQRFWKYLSPLLQLFFVWAFALLTGATSCVLRAAVMFSFVIIGKAIARDANIYNSLAASAFFLLLYNPYFLFDVSFQLSYIGLLSIVYFHPYIYKYGMEKVWFFSEYWLSNKIWELISVSLAAMIATTPLSLYYFHQFPPYFWLSGIVVVPLATLALYTGLVLFTINWFTPLAIIVGQILHWCIWIMNKFLFWIEQIPPGVIRDIWLNMFGTALWYILIYFIAAGLFQKKFQWFKYAMYALVLILLQYNYLEIKSNRQNLLVFYDAGKEMLLDIFEGENVIAIQSEGITTRNIEFSSYNNRIKHRSGTEEIQSYTLKDSVQTDRLQLYNGFCRYKDKTILFLNNPKFLQNLNERIKVDYLLVYGSPFLDFDLLTQKIETKQMLFGGGNRFGSLKFYKTQCEQRNIAYYDIKEKGAMIVALKE
jgi:competence protein ComEC